MYIKMCVCIYLVKIIVCRKVFEKTSIVMNSVAAKQISGAPAGLRRGFPISALKKIIGGMSFVNCLIYPDFCSSSLWENVEAS